jgi:hypothetical protein
MSIEPDTKDWTWVVDRPCAECGFVAADVHVAAVPDRLRRITDAWVAVLGGDGVAARPRPDRWSALEYGCHVRDVFRIYDQRLHRMLSEDDPLFANWDQGVTAVEERYGEQDPATVAASLAEAGERVAASYAGVGGDQWPRTGRRSDGARFTVDSFTRYFIHDPVHHLWDVGAPLL